MENTFQPSISTKHFTKVARASVFTKFMNWCAGQETYRLGWLGAILAIHGCVLTPITLFAVILSGTNFAFYMTTLVAMAMAVVTNLAAMPTRITIPVFILSIVLDITVVVLCVIEGFNFAATQI
jgi:hypothetical protein